MAARITENLGIDVLVLDINGAAYTLHLPERDVIVVQRTVSWFRQNFSLAHELGHILSGHMHQVDRGGEEEKTANAFAAELLMPEDVVRGVDWATVDLSTVAQLVWDLGISNDALSNRLGFLGITPCGGVENALTENTFAFLRHHWAGCDVSPDPITRRRDAASTRMLPATLLSDLEHAVVTGRAPAESLAWAMDVPVEDLGLAEPNTGPSDEDVTVLLRELP
ncbi:ImmA/IrrE family metallo-endopeptidase [Cutibacterium equinum]|uniref:ImmA/IrrE family metallo-endopeptidase n=1 Tax=Cutibacterium equinum TaxID=3016342 RepID=A0ABY7QYR0_9ACTN|nr:ImmA/IrrE family metallo-endopeptidase [Cutibacterium equinum]WCC79589.1 ImmA/IrrE family metallo-endopeptidase [Cutibacterium equinum]